MEKDDSKAAKLRQKCKIALNYFTEEERRCYLKFLGFIYASIKLEIVTEEDGLIDIINYIERVLNNHNKSLETL